MLVRREPEVQGLLTVTPLTGVTGLSVTGEVDVLTRDAFAAALDALLPRGGDIHLHLRRLAFIDIGGAAVIATRALCLPPDRHVVLHDPPPELRRLIGLMWSDLPGIELDP